MRTSALILIALVGGLVASFKTTAGKRAIDWGLLHFPIINGVIKKINLARFARIMSSLMASGLSVIEGLKVTAQAIDNSYYRELVLNSAEQVRVGKRLTESLSTNSKLFPYITTQMLEIGEETGSLEDIMKQIAEHYEVEVDDTMKNFSSIIEPLLLLTIGVVVGFLALALIMPIYNITQNI